MEILNSKEHAIFGKKWSNPGASFYDKIKDSQAALNEAYLVHGKIDAPYTSSGYKYPHHSLNSNGDLVVNATGVKAAYQRAKQMGIFKGEVKKHLMRHYKELGIYQDSQMQKDELMKENFEYIEACINKEFGTYLTEDVDTDEPITESIEELESWITEKSHSNLKYCYRIGFDVNTGEEVAVEFELDPEAITGASSEDAFNDAKAALKAQGINVDKEFDSDKALEYTKKAIKKYGHIDFISDKLKVHSIFTKGGKGLQEVVLIPLYSRPVIDQMNATTFQKKFSNSNELLNSNEFKENIVNRCKAPDLKYSLEKYKVGEEAGANKYKTTKLLWDRDLLLSYKFSPILRGFNTPGKGVKDAMKFVNNNTISKFKEDSIINLAESIITTKDSWGNIYYESNGEEFRDYRFDIQDPPLENMYLDSITGNNTINLTGVYECGDIDTDYIESKARAQVESYKEHYDVSEEQMLEECKQWFIKEFIENGWFDNALYTEASHGKIKYDDDIEEVFFIKGDNGIDNACVRVKGYDHPMRGRSSMITLKIDNDEVYVVSKKHQDGDYGVPGGGWDKGEDPKDTAIRELHEEAQLKVKDVKRMGTLIEYSGTKDNVHDWVKKHVPEKYWWYGYYSAVFVGIYDGKFKGHIEEIDKESGYDLVKYEDIKKDFPKEYCDAIEKYIAEQFIESFELFEEDSKTGLKYEFRYVINEKNGHLIKIIYEMKPENVTADNVDKGEAAENLRKNISKTGHTNYQSSGNKILGLVDMCDNSRINHVSAYPVIHNVGGSIMPMKIKRYMGIMKRFVKDENKLKEIENNIRSECPTGICPDPTFDEAIKNSKAQGQNPIEYKVGMIDNTETYKTTNPHSVLKNMLHLESSESTTEAVDPFGKRNIAGNETKMDSAEYDKRMNQLSNMRLDLIERISKLESRKNNNGSYTSSDLETLRSLKHKLDQVDNEIYAMEHHKKDLVYNEASHGKLKYDFRYAYDKNTGHRLKIVYELDNINITYAGHAYDPYKTIKTSPDINKEVEKNISKKGNVDHMSYGQKVIAIIDTVTGEKLQSAEVVSYLGSSSPNDYNLGWSSLTKDQIKEKINSRFSNECTIKVGEIDNTTSFKSTVLFNNARQAMDAEMTLKNGRGVKPKDIIPLGNYRNRKGEELSMYNNPTKKEGKDFLKIFVIENLNKSDEEFINFVKDWNSGKFPFKEIANASKKTKIDTNIINSVIKELVAEQNGELLKKLFRCKKKLVDERIVESVNDNIILGISIGKNILESVELLNYLAHNNRFRYDSGEVNSGAVNLALNDCGFPAHSMEILESMEMGYVEHGNEYLFYAECLFAPYAEYKIFSSDIDHKIQRFLEIVDDKSIDYYGMFLPKDSSREVICPGYITESPKIIDFSEPTVFTEADENPPELADEEVKEETPVEEEKKEENQTEEIPAEVQSEEPPALEDEATEQPAETTSDEEPPALEEPEETPAEAPAEEEKKEEKKPLLSMPKQTDAAEKNANGVNRKKLYIAFINWAKTFSNKNIFGSIFDKDAFKVTYPFIPHEMRYFYRLANPILCVLSGDLTFFQASELRKLNKDNKKLNEMIIFAATPNDLRVFNINDKKVYKATFENEIILGDVLAQTFDLYIQNMVNHGDYLNGQGEDEDNVGEEV